MIPGKLRPGPLAACAGSVVHGQALRRLVRWALLSDAGAGSYGALALIADDVHLRFGGQHPWRADARSRRDLQLWMRRLAHFGPSVRVADVTPAGAPWRFRIWVWFSVEIGEPEDGAVFVSDGAVYLRWSWGRLKEAHVFMDTQAVAAFFGSEAPEEFFAGTELVGWEAWTPGSAGRESPRNESGDGLLLPPDGGGAAPRQVPAP
jgi:ketosteroid isomerase-like protein